MRSPNRLTALAAFVVFVGFSVVARAQDAGRTVLVAADGQPSVGTMSLPKNPPRGGVLLLPARGSNRFTFDPLASRLVAAGLASLALDPRGHGDSVKDKDGKPIELGKGAPADPAHGPFADARLDAEAGLEHLIAKGAAKTKLAIVAAGASSAHALELLASGRVKTVVLLTPDAEETGLDLAAAARRVKRRPLVAFASAEDAPRGWTALKETLTFPEAEFRVVDGSLVRGTAIFGKVAGVEASLATWIAETVETPTALEIGCAPTLIIDGVPSPEESEGQALISAPLGAAGDAKIRVTYSKRTLDVGFDVPERYVRLNEVVIYVDASGQGARTADAKCYRVSFSPKNPARKPILVQRGGPKGFEDSDDKGVSAFGRTEDKARWTAEVSLDLDRFCGGGAPRDIRLAFQINGQRASDARFWPENQQVPTSPRTWAKAALK
jgi:pimeloyl-ACP methyl ester carboxylesterase